MEDKTPFRVIDTVEGSAFLEIRKALNVLRTQYPNVTPEHARVIEDPRGSAVVFEDRSFHPVAVRQGATAPLTPHETQRVIADAAVPKPKRSIQGAHIPLIESAAIEFARKLPIQFEQYVITVAEEGSTLIVMFSDRTTAAGVRGSSGRPGFEAAFDRKTSRMMRSNFVR
jgi:hypothetical protein